MMCQRCLRHYPAKDFFDNVLPGDIYESNTGKRYVVLRENSLFCVPKGRYAVAGCSTGNVFFMLLPSRVMRLVYRAGRRV